jgi:hypothetical protein
MNELIQPYLFIFSYTPPNILLSLYGPPPLVARDVFLALSDKYEKQQKGYS